MRLHLSILLPLLGLSMTTFSAEERIPGIDIPSARQMYVSCHLAQQNVFTFPDTSLESPKSCQGTVLYLIAYREGRGNRSAGQENDRDNFCLPETSNLQAMMIDAYIIGYEESASASPSLKNSNGLLAFAFLLSRRFPCN